MNSPAPMTSPGGFRTRQGVFWFTSTLLFAHLTLLILRLTREGVTPGIVAAALWLVVLMIATVNALKKLKALETEDSTASEAMRLALQLTTVLPVAGTVPLLFSMMTMMTTFPAR